MLQGKSPRDQKIGDQEGEGIEIGRRDVADPQKDIQLQRAIEILKATRILEKNGAPRRRHEGKQLGASPGSTLRQCCGSEVLSFPEPPYWRRANRHTRPMHLILGIESSCDETAAAVLEDGRSCAARWWPPKSRCTRRTADRAGAGLSAAHRGHHAGHRARVADAGITLADVSAVAVTAGPGLVGSLLVGVSVAKAIAYSRKLPLVAVNHLEGHIAAAHLDARTWPSLRGAGSLRGTHAPVSRPSRVHVSPARPDPGRRRRRSLRQGGQVVEPGISGRPVIEREAEGGTPGPSRSARLRRRRQPGFQLQRSQDGGRALLEGLRPRRAAGGGAVHRRSGTSAPVFSRRRWTCWSSG